LLLDKKADVNMKDMHANTALIIASETEDSSSVKILLKSKSDINFKKQ
jgi:ankyrin repeat protein